jgi:hypothetical protein
LYRLHNTIAQAGIQLETASQLPPTIIETLMANPRDDDDAQSDKSV